MDGALVKVRLGELRVEPQRLVIRRQRRFVLSGPGKGRTQHEVCGEMVGMVRHKLSQLRKGFRMAALREQRRCARVQEYLAGRRGLKTLPAQLDRGFVLTGPMQNGRVILDELHVDGG